MAKREFLQLAHTLNTDKIPVAGKFLSEKLDGLRFFWDGGVSRGVPVEQVPWANIEKSNLVPIATGLWSRYGKVVNAPNWWLNFLPPWPLDGELWTGYGEFQKVVSIVKSNVNVKEDEWRDVYAMVFDTPHPSVVLSDGEINNTNYKKILKGCFDFYQKRNGEIPIPETTQFASRYKWLQRNLHEIGPIKLHHQEQLPFGTTFAIARIEEHCGTVIDKGGEGVIIKSPNDLWTPERCWSLLKYKPWLDAEATVVGYTAGRETDKGSKLLGKMGALICEITTGRFKLSGFTDEERQMVWIESGDPADQFMSDIPGEVLTNPHIHNPKFPIGSIVTYKYRELTDDAIPKEARYWRKR